MIVVSDDEDEVEVERNETVGKQPVLIKSVPRVPERKKDCSDSDEDVRVVGEVIRVKKNSKGVTFGSLRYNACVHTHISNIRKRRRPDSSVVRYCSIRRSNTPGTHFHLSSQTIRKQLFQTDETIRLEERSKYVQLLESLFKGLKLQSCSANLERQRLRDAPFATSVKQRMPEQSKVVDVECVDLISDSENDIVEISQESKQFSDNSENDDSDVIEELPHDPDNNLIDLVNDHRCTDAVVDASSSVSHQEVKCVCSASSRHSQGQSGEKRNSNLPFSRVDRTETGSKQKNKDSRLSAYKGNLEERMLQQMMINDDDGSCIIDVDNNDNELREEDEAAARDENNEYDKDDDDDSDDELHQESHTEESFPEITDEMKDMVYKAFTSVSNKILIEAFNISIHARDIHTLKGNSWLNDEVINFYLCMLMERGKLRSYPSVYCFNTFFYVKLVEAGHASLRRWTRKIDIFSYELMIIPVHLQVHWCLACINFIEKRIEYYDSMGGTNDDCGKILLRYLEEEHLDKKSEIFNISGWEVVNMEDIPDQLNGSDCGVFVCTYAEYICRLAKLTFTQRDMPYFRVKMAYEILTKKLLL